MKTNVSRWQRFERQILNTHKRMTLVVCMLSTLSVDLACAAPGGLIRFHGHITEASCAARNASRAMPHERMLKVSPDINIMVNTADNACSQPGVPFALAYRSLPLSNYGTATPVRSGVVTMTYE